MRVRIDGAGCRRLCRRQSPEPDLSAESTPTGGWCQMKRASMFFLLLPKIWHRYSRERASQSESSQLRAIALRLHLAPLPEVRELVRGPGREVLELDRPGLVAVQPAPDFPDLRRIYRRNRPRRVGGVR